MIILVGGEKGIMVVDGYALYPAVSSTRFFFF